MTNSHIPHHHNGNGHNNGYNGEFNRRRNNGVKQTKQDDDDIIDLSKLFAIAWRYKWILVICVMAGGIASYVVANNMTPIYKSEGRLLIQELRNRYSYAGSDIGSLMTTAFGVGMGSTIANELEVIRSRRFMERVADNFLSKVNEDLDTYPLLDGGLDEDENQLLASKEQIAGRLLRGVVITRTDRESDVVNLAFESPSNEEAALVVNLVIDTYNEFSTVENRRMARDGLNFLQKERNEVYYALQQSEEALRDFMNQEGLVQLEEQSRQLINILAGLETEKRTAEVERSAVLAAIGNYRNELNSIQPGLGEQITRSYAPKINRLQFEISELYTERELLLSRNPILIDQPQIEPRLAEIERRKTDLESRVRDVVNELLEQDERFLGFLGSFDGNLVSRLSDLRKDLLQLEVREQQLGAQISVISDKILVLEREFDRLPDNMITFARLRRAVDLNTELFVLLERQSAEVAIWEQTQSGYGRLVDYGLVSQNPVKPRKMLIMLIGLFMGGMFGVAIMFIKELSQTTIMSVEKLREKGLQILAVVPDLTELIKKNFNGEKHVTVRGMSISTDMITFLDPISPASESYRRLYNNIIYSKPDNPYRTLITTSAGQGEGKTTTLSNLAVIMAEAGHKVVIVDCDFRRPRIHREFGFIQENGVSEWLFNELELDEVVKESVVPNIDVITAGKKVQNPANLVQSVRMKELIKQLRARYEYVLIDTPPYGIITDAAPLMREADGVILITRFGTTRHSDVDHTIENLQNINIDIVGTVLGAYDHEKSTGYYYYNDYYRYSYTSYSKYVEDKA
ncbi:MAG: polysaccharide biosynthesis tyrosine autokinase [Balneolales bacterium]|nr:polysaccharide biosynthesis tyrosine autokinase [Balneolales bacterium]